MNIKPRFMQMVGRWRANEASFTLTSARSDIDEGFGYISKWVCERCGPVSEPEVVCTARGCGFNSFWGPEPAEYEYQCPNCGRLETCSENENPSPLLKVRHRFTYYKHSRTHRSAA